MKTFILFWNPAISSYKFDDFQRELEEMTDYYNNMNWSVWEHEKAHAGDRFFMVRCGNGKTGICMSGYFRSNPYKDEDWSGRGRVTYYMDLEPDVMIHPEHLPILTTMELMNEIPTFDWTGGHSGRLLDEKSAEKLENLWKDFTERNGEMFKIHAFHQEVDPSDFVETADKTLFVYLSLSDTGKICVNNIQKSFDTVEEAKKYVISINKEKIDNGFKIEFKFEYIETENQKRFEKILPRLLSLKIPIKYYKLMDLQYREEEYLTIALYCLVKYGDEKLSILFQQGFSSNLIDAVKALLPADGESEAQHIKRIAQNEIATEIKIDMLENELNIIELDQISVDDIPRLNNAIKAIKELRKKDKPTAINEA